MAAAKAGAVVAHGQMEQRSSGAEGQGVAFRTSVDRVLERRRGEGADGAEEQREQREQRGRGADGAEEQRGRGAEEQMEQR